MITFITYVIKLNLVIMKKLFIIIGIFFFISTGFAQKVSVVSLDQKIEKIPRSGIATYLELEKKDVEGLWKKHIKKYGKVEKEKGVYYVNIASVNGISGTVRVLSKLGSSSQGTMVWFTVDDGDHYIKKGESNYQAAEKILYDFGIMAYRNEVMNQISDAEKAHAKAIRVQEKTVKKAENLANNLRKNGEEKVRLENALVKNAENKKELEQNIEQNKVDQAAAAEDVEKKVKAVDILKKQLDDIH